MAPPFVRNPKKTARFYRTHPRSRSHKNMMQRIYIRQPRAKKKIQELHRARYQDNMMGKGGKDYSHTSCGKLVRESPSKNRARQGAGGKRRLKKC